MSVTVADIQEFLTNDLIGHAHYMSEGDVPPDATPEEFAVLSSVRVRRIDESTMEVRYVEGPGGFTCLGNLEEVARAALARLQQRVPGASGLRFEVKIDPEEGFPQELVDAIETEAKAFLEENDFFVGAIGQADPDAWYVVIAPAVVIADQKLLEIVWTPGPGYDRLDPDLTANDLLGDLVDRIKQRVPSVKDYRIEMVFGD